jgi:DNA-binding beta-propeller fold protein YncE
MSIARKLMSAGPKGPEGAWDLSFAYYDPPAAWDISTSVFKQFFSVASQEIFPTGLFFKPDGLKMYVVGDNDGKVDEYDLSTAWDISTASFLQNVDVVTGPTDMFFKSDGTKMYILRTFQTDTVHEYDLSTAWDVSSATFLQSFSVATQDTAPEGLFFKPDGLKMYVVGADGDSVYEYDLSTAWDVSTATFLQSFSISSQETAPTAISFKPDGLKMYIVGDSGDDVNEYDLSTAWDVSSATFLQRFSVSAQDGGPTGIFFKPDGTALYICGYINDRVYQYTLGGFSVAAQETDPTGLFFKPDGAKMYVVGASGDDVNEYDLSTAWDVSTASYLQNFSVATQETVPQALFFKPDGTKMYVTGSSGDDVNEYDLSTAWDISSATFLQNFSVATEEIIPTGLFFKANGLKMYVLGNSGDDVNEYDLSSAWDVSTATFLQNFSVATQETVPQALFFKPDGTKMYVTGGSGDDVNEYDLSTAWDISTATFLQNFSVAAQETVPTSLSFKPDGTQMFIVGSGSSSVYSYTLGPQ